LAAALLLGVGGGFVLAAVLSTTQALGMPLGRWWVALAQAHGHLQLYGWAGLFVLGVLLHFLPRLRGTPLAFPQTIPWLLGLLVAGLLLRLGCQPLAALTGAATWRVGLATSGLLECGALGGILFVLGATIARGAPLASRPALVSMLPLLVAALGSLGLAALINAINTMQAAIQPSALVPPIGDELDVSLGLLGFLIPIALAMSARSLPMYAGLEAFPQRILWPASALYLLGLLSLLAGTAFGRSRGTPAGVSFGVGMALVGLALLLFTAVFVHLMRSRGRLPRRVAQLAPSAAAARQRYQTRLAGERSAYGPFVALVASAYCWAILGAVLALLNGLFVLLGAASPLALDAVRHSLALGCIALLICGIAPRMIPGFSGGRIASPALVAATLWLGNAAALFRIGPMLLAPLLERLGTLGAVGGRAAFGLSGPLGLALAICLALNLWLAIWPSARPSPS
jgi:uncharacterized protein involved in response to NO